MLYKRRVLEDAAAHVQEANLQPQSQLRSGLPSLGLHAQQANLETQPDHPNPLMEGSRFLESENRRQSKLSLASPQRLVYCLSYIIMSELYPSVAPSLFANR